MEPKALNNRRSKKFGDKNGGARNGPKTKCWQIKNIRESKNNSEVAPRKNNMKNFLLILLTAALLEVSSLVPALCWLALFAFIPVLLAIENRPVLSTALLGALLFFCVALEGCYWIFDVAHYFGGMGMASSLLAVPVFALLNIWQAVAGFALFAWLRERLTVRPSILFAVSFVAAWHFIPVIFFWDLSMLLQAWLPFVQSIDIFGTFGLDCFILFFNYEIFLVWRTRRFSSATGVAFLLLAANLGYGTWRMHALSAQLAAAPTTTVAMIQPNIASEEKRDPNFIPESLNTLIHLTDQAVESHPDLVVWPESMFPLAFRFDPDLQKTIKSAVQRWQTDLFFGSDDFERSNNKTISYNSSFLVRPDELSPKQYRKHVLLAFGETIPLAEQFPWLRDLFPPSIGDFGRGPGPTILHGKNYSFNPLICYESTQTDYVRANARLGADFMVEITNDGWYFDSSALLYHKNMAALRAIENRRSLIRTTNTGRTLFIDPLGRETGALPIQQAGFQVVKVPHWNELTFFNRTGYRLKALGLALLFYFIWKTRFGPKSAGSTPSAVENNR